MDTISTKQAANHIRFSKGKIFAVEFIKRTDGQYRIMVGRTGVRKGRSGVGRRYDPAAYNLLTVAEFAPPTRDEKGRFIGQEFTNSYRSIPVDGIRSLKIGGKTFRVIPEKSV